MRFLCTHFRETKPQRDEEGRNCPCTWLLFPLGNYQEVLEGGQSFLRAQEEARLADNPTCGVRGSFSGAEFELFSFAGTWYVFSVTEGWQLCSFALMHVFGL